MNATTTNRATPRKPSAIFRMAAKLVEDGKCHHSCSAVSKAAGYLHKDGMVRNGPARKYYGRIFQQPSEECRFWPLMFEIPQDERRDLRVLALCFAAAVAESEGR